MKPSTSLWQAESTHTNSAQQHQTSVQCKTVHSWAAHALVTKHCSSIFTLADRLQQQCKHLFPPPQPHRESLTFAFSMSNPLDLHFYSLQVTSSFSDEMLMSSVFLCGTELSTAQGGTLLLAHIYVLSFPVKCNHLLLTYLFCVYMCVLSCINLKQKIVVILHEQLQYGLYCVWF